MQFDTFVDDEGELDEDSETNGNLDMDSTGGDSESSSDEESDRQDMLRLNRGAGLLSRVAAPPLPPARTRAAASLPTSRTGAAVPPPVPHTADIRAAQASAESSARQRALELRVSTLEARFLTEHKRLQAIEATVSANSAEQVRKAVFKFGK